ncbi:hypothetical protein C2E21_8564 [Chlorella sorokiniana]|uniref:DUF4281 domain-containing protein n=1 Tax=Chlorella sorokiniana TaxID=3076 RepID=A0A2P6TDZ8_CHLSO|nr:hypothetical protein C2E21_8564 [Chlorella sorokiniana]|eukprot:PRW20864.1 hypothetical protein C2E21_8564 [Chlorella sorokiniana]
MRTTATVLVLPFYALMIAAPRQQLTQRLFNTPAIFTAAAALYALLLAMWQPLPAIAAVVQGAAAAVAAAAGSAGGPAQALRTALPSMPAFAALFGSPEITALAWVHLVLLDLLQARWVYQDGRRNDIPTWHSAVLCFMVGPLGLLCHLLTKALLLRRRGSGRADEYVVYRF